MTGKMNKTTVMGMVFFLLTAISFTTVSGEERIEKSNRFQLELFSGYSFMDPEHLNSRPAYNEDYEIFRYIQQFVFYNNRQGDYHYTVNRSGDFKKIVNGIPFGGRVKFSLNRLLALSLGMTYLERTAESSVVRDYHYEGLFPDNVTFYESQTFHRQFSPYSIHLRNISTLLGIHFRIGPGSNLQFELYAAGGPVFSACDISLQMKHEQMDYREFGTEILETLDMEGNGIGYNIDFGLRINIRLLKPLGIFIEAGYSFQRGFDFSGEGRSQYSRKDTNSAGYTIQNQWNGKWNRATATSNQLWGSFTHLYPVNWNTGGEQKDFFLDTSGLRLRMGLSIGLF